jgi:enoyl-CoA hydratase/carnithine racemase
MRDPFVLYEKSGRIVTLTLNRPARRNAIAEHADCEDIVEAVGRAEADAEVSVVILTGAGPAFCSGGDLQSIRDRNGIGPLATVADTRSNYRRGVQRAVQAVMASELVIIGAVNGAAFGLGCDIACLADIRLAADTAKFASNFVKIGLVPGDGGAWILPRVIGYPRAAELMLTGDPIGAAEALQMGLVNKVVPADRLMEEARAFAERVAVNPPRSLRMTKRLLREAQNSRLSDVLELSAALQAIAHETADHREGVEAFLAKRKPVFTGK